MMSREKKVFGRIASFSRSCLFARVLAVIVFLLALGDLGTPVMAQSAMKRSPFPGLTVEIVDLKRIGDKAVGLTYKVSNETDKEVRFEKLGAGAYVANVVALVDFKNGKRYGVGKAGKKCLCSSERLDLDAKSTRQYWAQFGAPPAGVDKVTVIIGNVPPFYDVAIQK